MLPNCGHAGGAGDLALTYRLRHPATLLEGCTAATSPLSVCAFDLGYADGVPLGFTNGAALPGGGWVSSAVAENTTSSCTDAACAGARRSGTVAADSTLGPLRRLVRPDKVEGIDVQQLGRDLSLFMVIDADDPEEATWLLSARL